MLDDVRAAIGRLSGGFAHAHCPDNCQECNDARTIAQWWIAQPESAKRSPIDPGKIVITPALHIHTEQNREGA